MSFLNNPAYRDKWFIILFVPFANTLNYFLSYTFDRPIERIILTYAIDTVQGYLVVLLIRSTILLLDRKIGYFQNLTYRLTVQILATSFVGLLFIALTTELVVWIAQAPPIPFRFYTHIMPIFFIWILVINGVYVALYFYHHLLGYQAKIKLLEQAQIITNTASETVPATHEASNIIVSVGKQQILLNWADIACFYVEDELSLVLSQDGKKYIVNHPLEKIEEMIDSHHFFRANRQIIIHKTMVSKIIKQENGKLSIVLKPLKDIPSPISISRTKAPAFKKWIAVER